MACEGCTCGRAELEAAGNGAPIAATAAGDNGVAQDTYTRELRSFTAPAEGVYPPSTSSGPTVPLRSKLWFDDKNDPGKLARSQA